MFNELFEMRPLPLLTSLLSASFSQCWPLDSRRGPLTLMLVERFEPTSAYLSVVGLFGGLGRFASALSCVRMPTALLSFCLTVPGRALATTSAFLTVLLRRDSGSVLTLHKANNLPTGLNHQGSIATVPGKHAQ